jgi:type II secretory pathway component PulM
LRFAARLPSVLGESLPLAGRRHKSGHNPNTKIAGSVAIMACAISLAPTFSPASRRIFRYNAPHRNEVAMLALPQQLKQITRLLALKSGKSPEDILKEAIEASARAAGMATACEPKRSPH